MGQSVGKLVAEPLTHQFSWLNKPEQKG